VHPVLGLKNPDCRGVLLFSAAPEEGQSDGDDFSVQDESGTDTTEGDATMGSSDTSSPVNGMFEPSSMLSTPNTAKTRASHVAETRGLAISASDRGNRHSRMMMIPSSPRPGGGAPNSPMYTPRA
jgi:RalA-binding protein 1